MIIEIEEDVIKLSGKVNKNLWPATQAAATMMLDEGVKDIIVDCGGITEISPKGLETFSNAFNFMNSKNVRIFFVGVDERIEKLAKKTPGIRSAMPIADNVEIARKSIAIDRQLQVKYKSRDLLFPMVGNVSHAIMFADLFVRKDREFTFVYPLIIPRKYNLYHPLKSLEDKANSDLGRVEGFCAFCNRIAKKNLLRVRDFSSYFKRLESKFPKSHILMSFAGCDGDKNQNRDKFTYFLETINLNGIVVTEPFLKNHPFYVKTDFKKILVFITNNTEYDRQTCEFCREFANEKIHIEFIKTVKIKFNESPREPFDYIYDFSCNDIKNAKYKTVSVRQRSRFLKTYIKENEIDMLILPALEGDVNFMSNMAFNPLCTTCFVSKNFY